MNSGYSKTPLDKKLGLKVGFSCHLYNAPKKYSSWIESLDLSLNINDTLNAKSKDFIHAFFTSQESFEPLVLKLISALRYDGMLWVSWPKGSSTIKTNLKRDPIRTYLLANGLVDVKVAAIDEDWSGLKFIYRLKDRK